MAFIIHTVPLATFEDFSLFDSSLFNQHYKSERWLKPVAGAPQLGYSFNGAYIYHGEDRNLDVKGYVQVFGNGIVEFADMHLFTYRENYSGYRLPSPDMEITLTTKVYELCQFYQSTRVPAPIALLLSIFGADGYPIILRRGSGWDREENVIRQSPLFFPEILFEDTNLTFEQVALHMKPLLDRLWNALGYEICPHFYLQGDEWKVADVLRPTR